MRLQSTVVATLLWATAALAAPISNSDRPLQEVELPSTHADSQPPMNITADLQPAANMTADEDWPRWPCKKNFTEGEPLTKLERIMMKICYKELLRGESKEIRHIVRNVLANEIFLKQEDG